MILDLTMLLVGKIIHHFNSATVLALTATAPPQLETDLSHILSLKLNVVQKSMNRENISLQHYNFNDDEGRLNGCYHFYLILGLQLYMFLLKRCLELAQMIYDSGYLTGIYHGDLSYQERQTVQQQFLIMTSPL